MAPSPSFTPGIVPSRDPFFSLRRISLQFSAWVMWVPWNFFLLIDFTSVLFLALPQNFPFLSTWCTALCRRETIFSQPISLLTRDSTLGSAKAAPISASVLQFSHFSCSQFLSSFLYPCQFISLEKPNPQKLPVTSVGFQESVYLFVFWLYQVLLVAWGIFLLKHANSVAACGIYFPDQGSNLDPQHWERGVLATKPPKKSSESVNKCVPYISAENM